MQRLQSTSALGIECWSPKTYPGGKQTKNSVKGINTMKTKRLTLLAAVCAGMIFAAGSGPAAEAKTYQVTGPILELTATTITVQKGDEKWQIARDKDTKVTGELKVGSKVTIHYQMVAAKIEVKEDKAKK